VIEDVDLRIKAGQVVALVGESGAGKSTLAALIPRFYELQKGRILIDGRDVMDLRLKDLRSNVGIVQQDVFLFDATIRENIMFARPDATEEELIEAARNAHILEFVQRLPDGFESLVGERGVMLSGGQKQRISMARLFLKNPPMLIFDEATSSLDSESEDYIQESLEQLCAGRSTLIIAHRLSTVRKSDYTYVMRGGRVVEHGTHSELLAKSGYYSELYNRNVF
jgi:ATP-binding cassette subfamily B protein